MDYGMDACIYDWMEESTDEKTKSKKRKNQQKNQ